MSFVESDSGRILNLDHVADLNPVVGGSYRLRWSNGMIETLSSTDGDAIRDALRPRRSQSEREAIVEKEIKKESKPRGRPRKTEAK